MQIERGDIAMVCRVPSPLGDQCNGFIVKVVHHYLNQDGFWYWTFEQSFSLIYADKSHSVVGVREEYLRPIRGQDGADETLQWAGKPQGVEA